MRLLETFESFPMFLDWLAETHHHGRLNPLGNRCGLSQTVLDRWIRGQIRQPRADAILRLCKAYRLDFAEVYALILHDAARAAEGHPIPLPDRTKIKPGRVPRRPKPASAGGHAAPLRALHVVMDDAFSLPDVEERRRIMSTRVA